MRVLDVAHGLFLAIPRADDDLLGFEVEEEAGAVTDIPFRSSTYGAAERDGSKGGGKLRPTTSAA